MLNLFRNFFLNTKLFYFSLFFVFSFAFLGHYVVAGQAVYGDGIEYYAWLHSAYFDHDIDFLNERIHKYDYEHNNGYPNYVNNPPELTQAKKVGNFHMPGMAVLLFPFYALADLITIALNFLGFNLLRNGYSNIYQIIAGFGAVFYGVLGIFLTEKFARNILSRVKKVSALRTRLSVITVVMASPIFYYIAIDVLNSHFATFFLVSLFYYLLFSKRLSYLKFILLGVIIGMATWIRTQELVLFASLGIFLLFQYFNKTNLINVISYFSASLTVFLIFITPLFFAWQYLYGNIFLHPYFVGFIDNGKIDFFGSLIDPMNGLFTKTPFILLLLAAIPAAYKKFKKEFIIFAIYFLIQIIGITKYGGWPAASYGARMYISSFPLFFLLSGILFTRIKKKLIILTIIAFFISLNMFNILNFMLFDKQAANGRQGLEPATKIKVEKILNYF